MPILVQKFGGTSVADAHRIHLAARRAIRAKLAGHQVVMVVSAMGHTTDHLVELAYQVARQPSQREMDMLLSTGEQVSIALMAMAIHEAGHDAISQTGAQIGLVTDAAHSRARIRSIDAARLRGQLDAGRIVIVAGFQGVTPDFDITTLGRGGSDTTAVALAAALQAEACEIYTDVDGVYTTDPRIVPEARKLDYISYDEMLEMASLGAGVMHGRSIELGKKYLVPIHVRSSFTDNPGTMIMDTSRLPGLEDIAVRGATLKREVTRATFVGLPNQPGIVAAIFNEIAQRGLLVDDIIQNTTRAGDAPGANGDNGANRTSGACVLGFTVEGVRDAGEVQAVAERIAQRYGLGPPLIDDQLSRVSIIGVGMRSHRGVAAKMFEALAAEQINIENISTSEIVVSVLVRREEGERALKAVHRAFELDAPQPGLPGDSAN